MLEEESNQHFSAGFDQLLFGIDCPKCNEQLVLTCTKTRFSCNCTVCTFSLNGYDDEDSLIEAIEMLHE
jgi:hypothetical protein